MAIYSTTYDPKEELWNVITHGLGLLLSIVGLIVLIIVSSINLSTMHIIAYSIYGVSLVILYAASTAYHMAKKEKIRLRLNVFDHSAIYVLIAGTYTPIALITLHGIVGWSLLAVIWVLAIVGIVLKLFYTGRFDRLSTLIYVFMGWLAVVAIKSLIENMSMPGLIWLLIGGLFYTIGAVFYLRNSLKFNHVIFHIFVLLGSISHFICILFFV